MNLLKRLFSKKNKNSKLSDNEVNSKPKMEKYFTNADTNNMNKKILVNEIYIEDIPNNLKHKSINGSSSPKLDEVPLDTSTNAGSSSHDAFSKSVDTFNTHYGSTDMDAVSSTGTDSTIAIKDITTDVSGSGCINDNTGHIITGTGAATIIAATANSTSGNNTPTATNATSSANVNTGATNTTSHSKLTVPTISKGACNINSVTGVEDILNKIIKELNNIIIQRERLRRKLKLRENSYKLIKKKFNTVLNNKLYKPIKLM